MTSFPQNLKTLRTSHGYSLKELSDRLNERSDVKFSKASIDRWEKGLTSPSMSHASVLAQFFNVTLDELSGLEEMREQQPQTIAEHLNREL
ncbi:helix-turn-helix domain-containing protein [Staphylococcus argensis]|uniref:XRE family transcriptional regulator n=1 Tax=Staphylococcus argensis TaxID=1607738 RepID=A0A2K4FGD5_9STAP|nr:helix-turn-helix transcriptional regulator [Staphylococcus argensis]MCY6990787.1 helix-turn-helix domain-containing protein [Staphylococcus argensis]POA10306.1 XRE family transcriptional regulator [Staphylococcus argensis]